MGDLNFKDNVERIKFTYRRELELTHCDGYRHYTQPQAQLAASIFFLLFTRKFSHFTRQLERKCVIFCYKLNQLAEHELTWLMYRARLLPTHRLTAKFKPSSYARRLHNSTWVFIYYFAETNRTIFFKNTIQFLICTHFHHSMECGMQFLIRSCFQNAWFWYCIWKLPKKSILWNIK